MNLLQSIPENKFGPVLVTLNPPYEPKKDLVVGEWDYEHPLFTEQASLPFEVTEVGLFCSRS